MKLSNIRIWLSLLFHSHAFFEPYTFAYARSLAEVVAPQRYSRRAMGQKQVPFMLLIGVQPQIKWHWASLQIWHSACARIHDHWDQWWSIYFHITSAASTVVNTPKHATFYIILDILKPISSNKKLYTGLGPGPTPGRRHAMAVPLDVVDFYLRRGGCEAQDEEVLRMVRRMGWSSEMVQHRNALVKQ